ncbi:MAG: CBS domain-containing protein [Bacteroidota bacterium]
MFAEELLSNDIFPLKKTDTCESVLVFMSDWKVFHLPVADNGTFLGYVSYDEINNHPGKTKIEKLIQPLLQLYVDKGQHLFEIIKLMSDTGFTCIAISDDTAEYKGVVSIKEIVQVYKSSSLAQPGGIIVLEMTPQDYSLAELSRIVEYNDAKILHVFVNPVPDNVSKILVSLKLNRPELSTIVQTLERYQYRIHSVHQSMDQSSDFSNRYEWLLKYLNT